MSVFPENDIDEYLIWLNNGIERGWISKPYCSSHTLSPNLTEEQIREWDEGYDPCCFVAQLLLEG